MNWLVRIWHRVVGKTEPQKPQKRICYECNLPIRRNHKFFYYAGRTIHKDCANPILEPTPPQIPLATGKDSQA